MLPSLELTYLLFGANLQPGKSGRLYSIYQIQNETRVMDTVRNKNHAEVRTKVTTVRGVCWVNLACILIQLNSLMFNVLIKFKYLLLVQQPLTIVVNSGTPLMCTRR